MPNVLQCLPLTPWPPMGVVKGSDDPSGKTMLCLILWGVGRSGSNASSYHLTLITWETMRKSMEVKFGKVVNLKQVCIWHASWIHTTRTSHCQESNETMQEPGWGRRRLVLNSNWACRAHTREGRRRPQNQKAVSGETCHTLLDSLYEQMLNTPTGHTVLESIKDELDRYMREPVINRKTCNPLEWWKQNNGHFTRLWSHRQEHSSVLHPPLSPVSVCSTPSAIYMRTRGICLKELMLKNCASCTIICPFYIWEYWLVTDGGSLFWFYLKKSFFIHITILPQVCFILILSYCTNKKHYLRRKNW